MNKRKSNAIKRGFSISEGREFSFLPTEATASEPFVQSGVGRMNESGEFVFEPIEVKGHGSQAQLLKLLPHGRLSRTLPGALRLTISIQPIEEDNAIDIFNDEVTMAMQFIMRMHN